jgi:hypothetical protein
MPPRPIPGRDRSGAVSDRFSSLIGMSTEFKILTRLKRAFPQPILGYVLAR